MSQPERAILADRELLARTFYHLGEAHHPLVQAAYEADARYLRKLIDCYEKVFFDAHDI